MKLNQIQIRDPFVLPDARQGLYYLFGSTGPNPFQQGGGFDVYTSPDLIEWEGPKAAFRPPADFWSDREFWAPEVHEYRGRYYMFATFNAEGCHRGTQILVSETPGGPYRPHSPRPLTPPDWGCLDGTFFVDEKGDPWMVFCHEWMQVVDGEMCAVRLSPDLTAAVGEPILLFRASEAKWVIEHRFEEYRGYITDGPFLYRTRSGQLLMLWSSFGHEGYAMGVAVSPSGALNCPWEQQSLPIYGKDGGHGMIFRDFSGGLYMTLHTPNVPPERPIFVPVLERNDRIELDSSRVALR